MKRKNVIVIDNRIGDVEEFVSGLKSFDKREWDVMVRTSNDRSSKVANAIRYGKYFLVGFELFIKRNRFNTIIAWQQFYGLIFAMLCRFFHVKKSFTLVVMTVIYKEKEGFLSNIYRSLFEYAIKSDYIDAITCVAKVECDNYSRLFKIPKEKFHYIRWGLKDNAVGYNCTSDSKKYIFSAGKSNRDWDFVLNTLGGSKYDTVIVGGVKTEYQNSFSNMSIFAKIPDDEYYFLLAKSYCVFLSIKDVTISAGQITLLQAMQFGKPVILTRSQGLTNDYVVNNENGIIVEKEKQEVLNVLNRLYTDESFYKKLSINARKSYENSFSSYRMGREFGELLVDINAKKIS